MSGTSCSRKFSGSTSGNDQKSNGSGCGAVLFGLLLAVVVVIGIVALFAK